MHMTNAARFLPCGDTALIVEFGDRIDRRISGLVIALAERLKAAALAGVIELVPTFRSLLVHYDPAVLPNAKLKACLLPMIEDLEPAERSGCLWRIPACYDPSVGPDLAELAVTTGLAPSEIAARHSAVTYQVYMIGFLPGFPYMGDVPLELQVPRKQNPRVAVPRGSIAIATTLTAIYPLESPGGWHLIGRTPVPLWDLGDDPPTLLAAGDSVVFEPVSLEAYQSILARVEARDFRLRPEPRHAGPAA
jgi:KipI family sensor histidine kinase inhibitor